MDANDTIKGMMSVFNDETIKKMVRDHKTLQDTGVLPEGLYKNLTTRICELYGQTYDLRLGEMWLQKEVFTRFLNA